MRRLSELILFLIGTTLVTASPTPLSNGSTNQQSEIATLSSEIDNLKAQAKFWATWRLRTMLIASIVAGFAFCAGLAAYYTQVRANQIADSLSPRESRRNQLKDAQVSTDLHTKDIQIATLNQKTAQAELEIARANERAEIEARARVQIELRMADRELTTDQVLALTTDISRLSIKHNITFAPLIGDKECAHYALQFERIFRVGNATVVRGAFHDNPDIDSFIVGTPRGASSELLAEASAIREVLQKNGYPQPTLVIDGKRVVIPSSTRLDDPNVVGSTIRITVPSKPTYSSHSPQGKL